MQPIGGLTDYRIDALSFSLYGVLVGLCLASDGFASLCWAVAAGAAAGVLILFRHLTVVYLAGVGSLWLTLMLGRLLLARREDAARLQAVRRLANSLLAAAIVAAVCLAAVAPKWRSLWAYYGVGHLTGSEKQVRAAEFGVHTAADSLLYYARSVWYDQAGWLFFVVAGLGVAATVWFRLRHSRQVGANAPRSLAAVALVALALFVPWLVLTASESKSPVVGNLLVMPLLWLAVLAVGAGACAPGGPACCGCCRCSPWPPGRSLWRAGTASAAHPPLACRDRAELLALHDDLARHAVEAGWAAPVVSLDQVVDFLPPLTQGVPAHERLGVLLDVKATALGGSIFEFDDQVALREVRASHFVLLTDGESLTNSQLSRHPVVRAPRQTLASRLLPRELANARHLPDHGPPHRPVRPPEPAPVGETATVGHQRRPAPERAGRRPANRWLCVRLSGKGRARCCRGPPGRRFWSAAGLRGRRSRDLTFPADDQYTLEFEIPERPAPRRRAR